jgi:polygalacturonase
VIGSEMSGGARNIFVENCTFLGTDKGLRFKSVRGRGGVVEHIYARNIFMKDIVDEAIFFDMYYFVKFATDGERDMRPEVGEGTPIFRNMRFEDIVCHGARKGVFIRGLPEMPVSDIAMENMVLQTEKGIELIDASRISVKNVDLKTKETRPVVLVDNSSQLRFDHLQYNAATDLLFEINGTRSQDIKVQNTDAKKAKINVQYGKEAPEKKPNLFSFN